MNVLDLNNRQLIVRWSQQDLNTEIVLEYDE